MRTATTLIGMTMEMMRMTMTMRSYLITMTTPLICPSHH